MEDESQECKVQGYPGSQGPQVGMVISRSSLTLKKVHLVFIITDLADTNLEYRTAARICTHPELEGGASQGIIRFCTLIQSPSWTMEFGQLQLYLTSFFSWCLSSMRKTPPDPESPLKSLFRKIMSVHKIHSREVCEIFTCDQLVFFYIPVRIFWKQLKLYFGCSTIFCKQSETKFVCSNKTSFYKQ